MRSAVTLSLVPEARNGPFVLHGDLEVACARAADLGFRAVELFPLDGEALNTRLLRQVLHRNCLEIAAVGTGAGWVRRHLSLTDPDPEVRGEARQFVSGMIEFAGGLGAPVIVGSMQGKTGPDVSRSAALGWLAEALEQLGPRAAAHGVPLLVEPLNRYETDVLNSISQTLDFIRGLRTAHIRILADLFHMNIEERSIPDALRDGGTMISHVHFADSNRSAVGLGHTDFTGVTAALRDIGYAGYLSAEVYPRPTPEEAARQTLESIRRLFPSS